MDQCIADLQSM